MKSKFKIFGVLALLLMASFSSNAQWQTQSIQIKPGWTAVFLDVDASYQTLDQLVGGNNSNPISQIWLWQTAPTAQFATTPQTPVVPNSQWSVWGRLGTGISSTFNC